MSAPSLFSLEGRVGLVTGSSRGLGFAMAEGLAEAGAHVVLNGRDRATLDARADSLRAQGHAADVALFDVTDEAASRAAIDAIDAIEDNHSALDILIANAGTHHARPLAEWTMAEWRRVMHANLDACFVLAQHAGLSMMKRRRGRILFTSSLTGLLGRPTIHAMPRQRVRSPHSPARSRPSSVLTGSPAMRSLQVISKRISARTCAMPLPSWHASMRASRWSMGRAPRPCGRGGLPRVRRGRLYDRPADHSGRRHGQCPLTVRRHAHPAITPAQRDEVRQAARAPCLRRRKAR